MSLDKGKMPDISASGFKFAIAASRFNGELVDALLNDALKTLGRLGAAESDIEVVRVPGAGELPFTCDMLARSGQFDAVIALGVVIAGQTPHHEIIAHSTANALHAAAARTATPAINGIVVTNNLSQAQARTVGEIARGAEFAEAAVEMAYRASALKAKISNNNIKK